MLSKKSFCIADHKFSEPWARRSYKCVGEASKSDELASDFSNWPGGMSTNNRPRVSSFGGKLVAKQFGTFSTASTRFGHRVRTTHSITSGVPRLGLPVGGRCSETSARGDGLTKRSLGCACRAFQSHHSSTATGCRSRILIRELIAVDRDETLLIRIVPRGKAAADNM